MKMDTQIFREYDIRGIFEEQFDLEFAKNLGRSFAQYLSKKGVPRSKEVAIGFDARLSSPDIARELTEGLISSGYSVCLIGLVTSPMTYFSTFFCPEIGAAMMVTGSHNPPNYNGFKVSVGKATIFGQEIQALKTIIEEEDYHRGERGQFREFDIKPDYVNRYRSEFQKLKDPGVVLDCGNGAAGVVARSLFESVGLHPEILFENPDGMFPNHHPDPTVKENLSSLIEEVKKRGARVGIGFDGDADRIGLVDNLGNMVMGDELLALMSPFVLQANPGCKIVGDVKCSDNLFDYVKSLGGCPIMWKSGHSLIKEKIKVENAPLGGELSGHIFFNDRNYGYDDALYAALRVVEVLSKSGQTIPQLLKEFPKALATPEIRIETTEEKKLSLVEKLKDQFSSRSEVKVNNLDGIRVSYPQGWALARPSNTQPVIVFRFEARDKESMDHMISEFSEVTGIDIQSYF